MISRVNTHLRLLNSWAFTACAVLPVTSTGNMHPTLVHQCRAPRVGISIDGGAGSVFYALRKKETISKIFTLNDCANCFKNVDFEKALP